jgi:excisionase family DNA binding protein
VTLLTVKQVADRLGISPALVYSLCARQRIRHERHGLGRGVIRVPEDAIDEYRHSRTVVVYTGDSTEAPAPRREPVRLLHLRLKPS